MKILITAGPSYEPIDEVRRLTNFSTGELGIQLSNSFAEGGFEVICLKGVSSTCCTPLVGAEHRPFTTNEDLLVQLGELAQFEIGAVFHAAALCDYRIKRVTNTHGETLDAPKIESRSGELTLLMEPARKLIGQLRVLFPRAYLVGWKYELNGDRSSALGKAWRQVAENQIDACVLNGAAWGSGFAFCEPPKTVYPLANKSAVAEFLLQRVKDRFLQSSR